MFFCVFFWCLCAFWGVFFFPRVCAAKKIAFFRAEPSKAGNLCSAPKTRGFQWGTSLQIRGAGFFFGGRREKKVAFPPCLLLIFNLTPPLPPPRRECSVVGRVCCWAIPPRPSGVSGSERTRLGLALARTERFFVTRFHSAIACTAQDKEGGPRRAHERASLRRSPAV